MTTLTHKGFSIRLSDLTQRPYRAALCDVLLVVTRRNRKEALAEFARAVATCSMTYSGLRTEGVDDLAFVKDFPSLRYLEIADPAPADLRPLESLSNLRGLMIESPPCGLDFACFPELEVFTGAWHSENRGLSAARELRRLHIGKYVTKTRDFSALAGSIRLEELHLTQTPIQSLDGLETLEDLRYLELAYAPKLRSLEAFARCGDSLRELSLQKLPTIASYQPLAALSRLRRLKVSSCAPMPDLKWTEPLRQLDFFTFVETNVIDGDMTPLLRLPALRIVGTGQKRRYNLTSDEVMARLAKARDDSAASGKASQSGPKIV